MVKKSDVETYKKQIEVLESQIKNLEGEIVNLKAINNPSLEIKYCDSPHYPEIFSIFEFIPAPVIIFEKQSDKIIHINSDASNLLGFHPEELINFKFTELFSFNSFIKPEIHSKFSNPTLSYRKKNGLIIQTGYNSRTVCINNQELELFLLLNNDEINNKIEEVLNSEALYKNIIQIQKELVARILPNGVIIFSNNAFQKYFNFDQHHATGQNFIDCFEPEFQSSWFNKISHLSSSNPGCTFEVNYKSKEGIKTFLEWTCLTIFDETGNIISFQVTGRDISKLKLYESDLIDSKIRAEESDRLKTIFLANMSHEIRTPMNSIIGFSTLLEDNSYSLDQKSDFIHAISISANNLLEIIQNITDLSLIESRQTSIAKTEFSLNRFFKELNCSINDMKFINNRENLPVNYRYNNEDVNIFTDKKRLNQILVNLIGNAIKFTHQGFVEYGYLIQEQEVLFFIKDTGIGIPGHQQEIIFEKFRQVDEGNTRKYGGLGLGLTISKALAELLGGRIWVESSPGTGSTFYFNMPLPAQLSEQRMVKHEEPGFSGHNWTNKTILAVEDENINFILLKKVLKLSSVNLIWAKNGQEAVDMVSSGKAIHLVLMDLKMPVKDGFQATIEIKALRPSLPVVALTAYSLPQDQKRALESGCNDFITKPINIDVLLKKVSNYML